MPLDTAAVAFSLLTHAPCLLADIAVFWGGILLFDTTVFGLTANCLRYSAGEPRGSLLRLMIRDGK